MTDRPPTADWMKAQLFERRIVLVSGELDNAAASLAAAELMTLDASGDDPISLRLDSSGGTLESAFMLMDVIDLLGVPCNATCVGRAEGPAIGVFAVASRRIAAPHARLRLCEPKTAFAGRARELAGWAEHHRSQLQRFIDRLADATRLPPHELADMLRAGRYLDADEALRIGLVDEIAQPGSAGSRSGHGVGFRP